MHESLHIDCDSTVVPQTQACPRGRGRRGEGSGGTGDLHGRVGPRSGACNVGCHEEQRKGAPVVAGPLGAASWPSIRHNTPRGLR